MRSSSEVRRTKRPTAAVVMGLTIVTLVGCSQSVSGSRHTLYDSIDALAADSSAIVVGTVTSHHVEGEGTVSSVQVSNAPTNPQLGANVEGGACDIAVGDVVDVREIGEPHLDAGGDYLLFLTPTMLTADAAADYYVTGADAGIYVRDGDVMRRLVTDSGDALPETISIAD
ncbi:hypothetical protein ACH3VR_11915 [Microbacterium sp. B2969]|uniref:Lipoprotein n=1 Tax=Microbacterium alkaliflavum TaxID=3248839 RepID=A0ABW7Q871_9MICO